MTGLERHTDKVPHATDDPNHQSERSKHHIYNPNTSPAGTSPMPAGPSMRARIGRPSRLTVSGCSRICSDRRGVLSVITITARAKDLLNRCLSHKHAGSSPGVTLTWTFHPFSLNNRSSRCLSAGVDEAVIPASWLRASLCDSDKDMQGGR